VVGLAKLAIRAPGNSPLVPVTVWAYDAGMADAPDSTLHAFLDTNVFLHFKSFRSIDWCSLLDAPSVELVVAPSVHSELDTAKWNPRSATIRSRARDRLKDIDAIYFNGDVALANGCTLRVLTASVGESFEEHGLSRDSKDDCLLATTLAFREGNPDVDNIVLVTADHSLAVKAHSRGLRHYMLDDSYLLKEAEDRELRSLKRRVSDLEAAQGKHELQLRLADGSSYLRLARPAYEPQSDEDLSASIESARLSHPRLSARNRTAPFQPAISVEQAENYNAKLELYFEEMSLYFGRVRSFEIARHCSRSVDLSIENSGSAPAVDVDVFLECEAEGLSLIDPDRLDKPLSKPAEPARPGDFGALMSMTSGAFSALLGTLPNVGPWVHGLRVTDSAHARFKAQKLKHGMLDEFTVTVVVDPLHAAPGRIMYAIHADNAPVIEGTINLVVDP
jgi:hypothetical protein